MMIKPTPFQIATIWSASTSIGDVWKLFPADADIEHIIEAFGDGIAGVAWRVRIAGKMTDEEFVERVHSQALAKLEWFKRG